MSDEHPFGKEAEPDPRGRPACYRADAVAVLQRLREMGHEAYFAGGCVRDLLLNIEPKDFDIATDAPPKRVRELFRRTQAVGAAFGVVLVRQGDSVVEVATFRSDGKYTDGRHPESVRFVTAREDAQRRDFTINGLFYDPIQDRVIDYVDGQADLATRRLRAIGDSGERFAEDHLRLLRAVRFAARFDLSIDADTGAAMKGEARLLRRITPERIADELRLMLTPTTRSDAWRLLWEFGLMAHVFRHVRDAIDAQPPERSLFTALMPTEIAPFPLALIAAAIDFQRAADGIGDVCALLGADSVKRLIRACREGLRISNAESDGMESAAGGARMMLGDQSPTLAERKRMLAMPTAPQSIALLRAIAVCGERIERIARVQEQLAMLKGIDVAPAPLISGDDLQAMGMNPGPRFKRILDATYDAQLEGTFATAEEAVKFAREAARRLER
ncbi:MAG: CCA tRNA nucleotidyltransferase [Phycisphaerae bacterium]|nr:CCA tRNA nucleotidyltransferase [Phycisphaerae bacterium]